VSETTEIPAPLDPVAWQQANDRYLSASLEWLRTLLRRGEKPEQLEKRRRWLDAFVPVQARTQEDKSDELVVDERLRAAAEARQAAAEMTPPPALAALGQLLDLSEFERDTLLLCAARELDPSIGELCARVQGDPRMTYPTFALALALFDEPAWDVLAPYRPLRYWRLVEVTQPAGAPLVTSALRAEENIVNRLKGLDYLDDRLEALVWPIGHHGTTGGLPPSQRSVVDEVLGYWRGGLPVIVQLLGSDEASKQLVAAEVAYELGFAQYRLPAGLLPRRPDELDTLARLWQRETRLSPVSLYLDAHEVDSIEEGDNAASQAPPIARFLARSGGAVLIATREARPDIEGPTVTVDVAPPKPAERRAAWAETLDEAGAEALGGQFSLDVPAIRQVAVVAQGDPERAWQACLARARPGLDALAQRLVPKVGWDDIVLPDDELAVLRRVADQVAQRTKVYEGWGFGGQISRGLGISALFSGPSGTGKTMAAEVLAHHLRLDLYRIDLSAVVSKYIGETEKRLRRLFDVAERGGAILFFDEAESLFSKRSEVRDAHDRYANIETAYLLQRMESYSGLAILATNMRKALDVAFTRRIRFIVEFKFPDVAERRAIWERVLPSQAPRGPLDLDRLARLPASGGMTRNIALNAAFSAAGAGSPITMPLLLNAARAEFKKLGLSVPERELTWTEPSEVAR
jgi:hypothetical protein